jgi:uncharacterized protein (DUF362 family)/Pyruvate/2-oxoacid:ferredoxin oxidoreductase delta subunit
MDKPDFQRSIAIEKILNEDVELAVCSALKHINASHLMRENMFILLKPNILSPKPPERAVCTHPKVVQAVIRWIKQFNPRKILVVESSGTQKMGVTERAFEISGIAAVCKEEGVEFKSIESLEKKVYPVPNPLVLNEITSASVIEKADLIINLPKIKTHGQCLVTCCIKNMFGTLPLVHKPQTHARFSTLHQFNSALADIYSVSHPQLTIIDGYYCQEGNGPSAGDVVKLDLILAGYDPVALDTTVCEIIDVKPEKVPYITQAQQKGLGIMDLSLINYPNLIPSAVKRPFKKPSLKPVSVPLPKWFAEYLSKTIFHAQIQFDREKCKLCGTCWNSCPVHAISSPKEMKIGQIPSWDRKKCITCYCCAELCPYEAVAFETNLIKNVLMSWMGVGFGVGLILIMILIFLSI